MKSPRSPHLLTLVCAGALAACANTTTLTKGPVSACVRPDSSLSSQVFQAVNAYRRSQGAKELQRHAGLDRLAQAHCEYLRQNRGKFGIYGKNVSHFGFDGRVVAARECYHMESVSENVAAASHAGSNAATALLALWKSSKDHQKNMLDDWTDSGVGVVVDSDGMTFGTQLFATASFSQMSTRERFNRF